MVRKTSILGRYNKFSRELIPHLILFTYTLIALFPVALILMNSFKKREAIFETPWLPPLPDTFSMVGYITVYTRANFQWYFVNSLVVTIMTMFLILLTGAMAAHALSEYQFPGNTLMGLYLALGIMIPIRLGTISILRLVVALGLINTLTALILVYTAQGLPLTIFILQQ